MASRGTATHPAESLPCHLWNTWLRGRCVWFAALALLRSLHARTKKRDQSNISEKLDGQRFFAAVLAALMDGAIQKGIAVIE